MKQAKPKTAKPLEAARTRKSATSPIATLIRRGTIDRLIFQNNSHALIYCQCRAGFASGGWGKTEKVNPAASV